MIDEVLELLMDLDANDAQLKIYLYLLRVTGAGLTTSISDMADQFNHTEKDVVRALKYWEYCFQSESKAHYNTGILKMK